MDRNVEDLLESHGVKPTAVRIVVWRMAARQSSPFSLNDMVDLLPDTERTSIFRSLRVFAEHYLLHEVDDGSGVHKYCVCRCDDSHHLGHVHFSCLRCGKTFCIEDRLVPKVALPEGYVMAEAEYVIKGLCPACSIK